MNARATPSSPKVTRLRTRIGEPVENITYSQAASPPASAKKAAAGKADVARYIGDLTLELERLAGTADLELLAYFLGMARAEAEAIARQDSSSA
jgi:hypothetical protein